jgi:acetyltransferase-like isoleucine patch superfamily enzyme
MYPRADNLWRQNKNRFKKTIIKKGVSIGANCTLICGITLYENSMVGAGSVVTKDVKKNTLVFGNPAKFFKYI